MKHYSTKAVKLVAIALSEIIICVCALSCAVVTTSIAPDNGSIEGMVYHLPSSLLKVSIESKKDAKGNHSELIVATSTEIVPYLKARLILHRSGNELFSRNHTFAFTNGLLSAVNINDEGKSGEIITSLAGIAMNVIKFTALPEAAPAGQKAAPGIAEEKPESDKPSNEEIMAALSLIAPGRQDYMFPLSEATKKADLPGTAELVEVVAKIPDLPDTPPAFDPKVLNGFEGIATRVLEPRPVNVSVNLKLPVLYANRIAAFNKKINELDKTINEITKKTAKLQKNFDSAQDGSTEKVELGKKLKAAQRKADTVNKNKEQIVSRRDSNQGFLDEPSVKPDYEIGHHSSMILIPDYSPLVKISLKRAPLGNTKLALTLDHGVLTNYHAENPSTVLEIIKLPLSISESILKLPTEILQLKIDYSSKAQALVEQQGKYQDALKALAEKNKGSSAYDVQVTTLEQEKAILQLQKEIAELKAAISKLETK